MHPCPQLPISINEIAQAEETECGKDAHKYRCMHDMIDNAKGVWDDGVDVIK